MLIDLHRVDARTGDAVRRLARPGPRMDLFMRSTTDLGSLFMVVPASTALVRSGHRREAAEMVAAGALAWFVGQRGKSAFNRRRPYQNEGIARLIPIPSGSSMPSGHAAVAAAVATVMSRRSLPGRRWPFVALAAYVPVTRVYLGVHYPGDTLVGACLGYGLGRAVMAISDRIVDGDAVDDEAVRQDALALRPGERDAPSPAAPVSRPSTAIRPPDQAQDQEADPDLPRD